jgi:prevent-host-death family protein
MQPVKIADLKNNLSRHLARVRRGGEITVLDRDTPVARIVPFTHAETSGGRATERPRDRTDAAERVAALARQGVLSPGNPRAVADWVEDHRPIAREAGTASAVDLLLEMRREPRR